LGSQIADRVLSGGGLTNLVPVERAQQTLPDQRTGTSSHRTRQTAQFRHAAGASHIDAVDPIGATAPQVDTIAREPLQTANWHGGSAGLAGTAIHLPKPILGCHVDVFTKASDASRCAIAR